MVPPERSKRIRSTQVECRTSDDDGSALTVWARPRAVRRNADAIHPANDKLEDLDHDTQKRGCEAAGEEGKVRRLHLSFPVTFSYFLLKN